MDYLERDLLAEIDIVSVLRKFCLQSKAGDLVTKDLYPKNIGDFTVKVSFGQGVPAAVPWIAVLSKGQLVSCGIYPVFLYYKENDHMILAYGVSEEELPSQKWPVLGLDTVKNCMSGRGFVAKRYGASLVAAEYPQFSHLVNEDNFGVIVRRDLSKVLQDYQEAIKQFAVSENDYPSYSVRTECEVNLKPELNQILFGPPGTGKTYHAINKALEILAPDFLRQNAADRVALKVKFDELVAAGYVRFVTFHQSFSYEDFIEGIRASSDGEGLSYHVESGVFKQICDDASYVTGSLTEDEVIEAFLENVASKPMTLATVTGKNFVVSYKLNNTTVTCVPKASATELELPANIEHIRMVLRGAEPSNLYCASYVKAIAEYLKTQLTAQTLSVNKDALPYVLIIDEINRGNISRIFGELITLIEPSKRAGSEESLSVVLPYSKERFSVPNNVYLIGTMNTADRSLTGLDIALRRRFDFIEMPPQPELLQGVHVEGIAIDKLLHVMNERIEVLLGHEYCIGHAYFMSLNGEGNTLPALADIFKKKVLPLLQEYFFDDWQRIAWVLNDHRKAADCQFVRPVANKHADLFGDIDLPLQAARWEINQAAFGERDAYAGIIAVAAKSKDVEQDVDAANNL